MSCLLRLPSVAALSTVLALLPGWVGAQEVRGSARTSARYLEARPITQDTVSRSRVTQRPDGSFEFEGRRVECLEPGLPCVFYRSLPRESAAVLFQEVDVTVWGLGVQGLSATALLRSRARLGGDFALPRSDDHFDAVLAYLELNRGDYRVRLGRQRSLSRLGATGYDGVDVLVEPRASIRLQGFAGRSLARGLSEPRQTALRGLDDEFFLPHREALLAGAEVGLDPRGQTSLALRYQFEIWADRGGMLSERAALTARTTAARPLILSGGADYDFAFGQIGRAHLTAQSPLAGDRLLVEATARRYVPYFELWTIWGYFSPVAHHEAIVRATWRASPAASLWAAGGYRRYSETNADILLDPLGDQAWRCEAGGNLLLDALTLSGSYRWEGPVGALLSSADATLAWQLSDRLTLATNGTWFQQAEEFRIGDGRVLGGGVSFDADVTARASLSGGVDVFRHSYRNRPSAVDWNQLRGRMALQVGFGRDPGVRRPASP